MHTNFKVIPSDPGVSTPSDWSSTDNLNLLSKMLEVSGKEIEGYLVVVKDKN